MIKNTDEKVVSPIAWVYPPVIAVLLLAGAFWVGRLSAQVDMMSGGLGAKTTVGAQPVVDNAAAAPAVTVSLDLIKGLFKQDLVKFGDANRKVLFVDVSDPSCPYCHAAGGLNPTLSKQMGPQFTLVSDGGTYLAPVAEMKKLIEQKKASYVWIYSNGHGNGELAAKALYCANEKGRFWEAHSLLFTAEGYDMINTTVKNDLAKSGTLATFLKGAVDSKFMQSCLESDKYKDRLVSDISAARALGVNGTPGFFVNATNFAGAVNFNEMKPLVDAALK